MNSPLDVNELKAVMDTANLTDAPDFLVRSRREVVRLFNGLFEAGAALSISVMNSEDGAESTLLDVDEPGQRLLLDCPPGWLGVTRRHSGGDTLMLTSVLGDTKIQFQSAMGEIIAVDDARVLCLPMPDFLWRFQRRRDVRRAAAGLKISLNLGFGCADAQVCDLGMGGIGAAQHRLEAGRALRVALGGFRRLLHRFGRLALLRATLRMLNKFDRQAEIVTFRLESTLECVPVIGNALQREIMIIFGYRLGDMVEPDALPLGSVDMAVARPDLIWRLVPQRPC